MKKIKLIDDSVELEIPDGDLAVVVSGGADSALLLYLLLKYSSGTVHAFTCAPNTTGRITAQISSRVIEKCIELTSNNKVTHYTWYTDYQTHDLLFEPILKFVNDEKKATALYSGVTANPPADVTSNFEVLTLPQDAVRNPNIKRPTFYPTFNSYTPFTNIDKQKIADIYNKFGLIDSLYPVTRSCEKGQELPLMFGHCGKCWWCQEREWGFSKYVNQ
jgi:7-cyano-7-deazaguanine synthase in queuosine biosynthesis